VLEGAPHRRSKIVIKSPTNLRSDPTPLALRRSQKSSGWTPMKIVMMSMPRWRLANTFGITCSTVGLRSYPKDLPVARVGEKIERAIRRLAHVADALS